MRVAVAFSAQTLIYAPTEKGSLCWRASDREPTATLNPLYSS
jgi:hypothetical protein